MNYKMKHEIYITLTLWLDVEMKEKITKFKIHVCNESSRYVIP